jgi:hypothetical protein
MLHTAGNILIVHASRGFHSGVVKDPLFWDMTPHHWVIVSRRFEGEGTTFVPNVGTSMSRRIAEEWGPHFNRCYFNDDLSI